MPLVQLINSPLPVGTRPSIRAGAYPPLHLASLATYLERKAPDCEIEILDGEFLSVREIQERLRGDWVGISANTLTYETALEIAKTSKQKGAVVVFGGPHARFAGESILRNREYVDFVVYADGEEALHGLVAGLELRRIPNLLFREGGRIQKTSEFLTPGDPSEVVSYKSVDLDSYFERFRKIYPEKPFRGAFAVYSAKGCQWRTRTNGGCVFCAIQHLQFSLKPPQQVWRELVRLNQEYGADFFWDVSDTFTMQREWIRSFAMTKPESLDVGMHIYARSSDIDPEMAQWLKVIGVHEVFIGLEAGDNTMLKSAKKGTTVASNYRALSYLRDVGISVVASIMLGLPGETIESASRTLQLSTDLATAGVNEAHVSILLPLPGSGAMGLLMNDPELKTKYEHNDLFDLDRLRREWVERFCSTDYETLVDFQIEIMSKYVRAGSFGSFELALAEDC